MFDPEQVPLSTSEGHRPSSTAADRMMVGLAILALVGGLLIALSRLLPESPEQASSATATPRPSVASTPRPTPLPRAVRTMTVDTAPVASPIVPGVFHSEWLRLRTRVTLLSSPSSTAKRVGALQRGDAAHVYVPAAGEAPEGWLQVDTPISGWMRADLDNGHLFERHTYRSRQASVVHGLAAHGAGFTAFGYTSGVEGELVLTSSDGLHWRRAAAPVMAYQRSVADGPAGWLMVGYLDTREGPKLVVWQSPDGREWQPMGILTEVLSENISSLAGSQAGYVLTTSSGGSAPTVWFSADGELWTERPVSFVERDEGFRVVATTLGFFAWNATFAFERAGGAFSIDGWTWSEAELIGGAQVVDVVADGDHLLALGRGPDGTRVWRGTIAGQRLTWSIDDAAPFGDAVLSRMVSDGERVIVLGWDRASEAPLWWERSGEAWLRRTLPAEFSGLPREAAGGPLGVVAIAQVDERGGVPPVFWHLDAGEGWTRESSAVFPAAPPLTPEVCGALPGDLLALLSIDPMLAADCFGDQPITVHAWSVPCDGCYGENGGEWEVAWLAQPTDRRLIHLSPTGSADWGSLDAVLHPSLPGQSPERSPRWVEVTGHYDDPEARDCRWTPPFVEELWYTGTADVVSRCRSRFVITAIHGIAGP